MTLRDDVETFASATYANAWAVTDGHKVPTPDSNIGLGNSAIRIAAVVLYADLADSTGLVKNKKREFATETYKNFVYAAAKCVRHEAGEVTAYDGDRVMGVFMGDGAASKAVRATFRLRGLVQDVIEPLRKQHWTGDLTMKFKVGIDASELWVANTGIRGNTDYVWVDTAANNAAKMATLPSGRTYISKEVWTDLELVLQNKDGGGSWWTNVTNDLGYTVYGSDAVIKP